MVWHYPPSHELTRNFRPTPPPVARSGGEPSARPPRAVDRQRFASVRRQSDESAPLCPSHVTARVGLGRPPACRRLPLPGAGLLGERGLIRCASIVVAAISGRTHGTARRHVRARCHVPWRAAGGSGGPGQLGG